MNFDQTAALLARIALVDNRPAHRDVALYWADLLSDVDYSDAVEAVRQHRRVSTDYLVPAHIVQGVAAAREARLAAFGGQADYERLKAARIDSAMLLSDPHRYRAETRALKEDILAGRITRTDALKELEA